MKILTLEFSSHHRSVAVLVTDARGHVRIAQEAIETGSESTKPFEMMQDVLRLARLESAEIERVAVGLGPGSYAGIRSAIAIAQGWQLAREVGLQGISSVECLAAQAHSEGLRGRISVVIDAQRGEFYLGRYALEDSKWHELQPLELASRSQIDACQAKGDFLIGPEVQNWFAQGRTLFPRAAMLAKLALKRTDCLVGELLEPIYLRASAFLCLRQGSPISHSRFVL